MCPSYCFLLRNDVQEGCGIFLRGFPFRMYQCFCTSQYFPAVVFLGFFSVGCLSLLTGEITVSYPHPYRVCSVGPQGLGHRCFLTLANLQMTLSICFVTGEELGLDWFPFGPGELCREQVSITPSVHITVTSCWLTALFPYS